MIKRPGLAAIALLVIAGLASCDRYQPPEAAATVNGHEISMTQLEELADGSTDPAVLRAALSAWIQVVAASEDPGELLTEADLAAQRELVLPPLIEATRDETRKEYQQGLDGSSLLCMAVIPLAADTTSEEVLDALDDGASFADLAAEFSEDPSLIETGGVISVGGQECLPTDQWNTDLLAQLQAKRVRVGTAGVIELNAAEVIVLLRPFDELSSSSQSALAQGPVARALLALYSEAEVTVNPSIGAWDAENGVVVEADEAASDN